MKQENLLTEVRLKKCRKNRYEEREELFASVKCELGEKTVTALRRLYDVYDEGLYIWYASLYDPEIGGFYFSESGRDTEGFLPDIESTVQGLCCFERVGLLSSRGEDYGKAIDGRLREKLVSFAKGLQDPENGYFYHPQWGRNIVIPRRGRDLSWSTSLLEVFGEKPDYPTPLERTADGNKSAAIPEHLQSLDSFKKYLREFDLVTQSYWSGNMLQSQTIQIKAAGQEFVDEMFDYLESQQREDNGLWEPEVNYASVNGLMKISLMYSSLGRPLKYPLQALESTVKAALSDQEIVFCCQFYNPLTTITGILNNIKKFGSPEKSEVLRREIVASAPALLSATLRKVSLCRKLDGSFSYNPGGKGRLSQKAPVALGINEGDVNATSICTNGVMRSIAGILGLPRLNLFGTEDSKLFFELLESAEQRPKVNPKPDWFDSCLVEEGTVW